ncbi:hypothetical protein HRbin15_00959 [bacterium HR15]|nr:hypothetical protein HRbin15_00959 [bacterium HR15]
MLMPLLVEELVVSLKALVTTTASVYKALQGVPIDTVLAFMAGTLVLKVTDAV